MARPGNGGARSGTRSLSISLADLAAHRARATDRTLIKALSRAYRWQKLLDDGLYGSITEIADKEHINPSHLSLSIRLSLLAPDIVEAILNGTQPPMLHLADLDGPVPI